MLESEFKGREVSSVVQDLYNEEASQKNIKDQMKEKISELEAKLKRLSSIVHSGEEYRDVKVQMMIGDNNIVTVVRLDTGEIVEGPREARPEEAQLAMQLFEQEAEAAKAEETKSEVIVPPPPPEIFALDQPNTVDAEFKEVVEESTGPGTTSVQDMPHSDYVPPAEEPEKLVKRSHHKKKTPEAK
jgi:hypothetical protein